MLLLKDGLGKSLFTVGQEGEQLCGGSAVFWVQMVGKEMTQVLLEPLSFEKSFVLGCGRRVIGKDMMPRAKIEVSREECSLLILWFGNVAGGCV